MTQKIVVSIFSSLLLSFYIILPTDTFAHEAYVLNKDVFNLGLKEFTQNPFSSLFTDHHSPITIFIFISFFAFYVLCYLGLRTKWGYSFSNYMKKLSRFGKPILRLSLGFSLVFSALNQSIFGPELILTKDSLDFLMLITLYISGFMFILKIFMPIASTLALILFFYSFFTFGIYVITYASYLGVILFFMLEKLRFKTEIILRILFGIAIFYTAYFIKIQHQHLFEAVYNQYHLQQFFQLDSVFASSIAAALELVIGSFIIFGFALIPTLILLLSLLSFFLFYLGENLWPHLILFGICIYLLLGQFSSNKHIAKKNSFR